jgi:hypothetical protein
MVDEDDLLRCADRFGRTVILRADIWYDKILVDHPEMAQSLDAIEETLMNPDRVTFDATYANGENFYRRRVLRHPFDLDFLKVVVRYVQLGDQDVGDVISAFSVPHSRKPGERFRWNR